MHAVLTVEIFILLLKPISCAPNRRLSLTSLIDISTWFAVRFSWMQFSAIEMTKCFEGKGISILRLPPVYVLFLNTQHIAWQRDLYLPAKGRRWGLLNFIRYVRLFLEVCLRTTNINNSRFNKAPLGVNSHAPWIKVRLHQKQRLRALVRHLLCLIFDFLVLDSGVNLKRVSLLQRLLLWIWIYLVFAVNLTIVVSFVW